ncbi:MAG TPA: glycosyl hydrolase family 8 [Flavisolibacter sp.]|nr:glycosyl hydrolase family 8 [Flavisolibacter sp.]
MKLLISFLLFVFLFLTACRSTKTNGIAEQKHYRNLFLEAGYKQEAIKQKIENAFHKLFYGNKETEAVYFEAGQNANGKLAYIPDVNNNDVRSEGMSYGMMIALQMDKKEIFDALWNWSKTYMYHSNPAHPAYGYFSWSSKTDGTANDEMPAPDGEEYYATALYFASARWGDGIGIYNYKKEADTLTTFMRHKAAITGEIHGRKMTAINLFDEKNGMVRFTPDLPNAEHTDASYHLPAFYEVWAIKAPVADRAFWKKAATVSREYFEKAAHPSTGLTPDYGNFDGTPWIAPWRRESGNFSYDAWRTVMNWGVDWSWWHRDERAIQRSKRLLKFFESEGMSSYGNQYTLDGKKLQSGQPTGLIACNATAALADTSTNALKFVRTLWDRDVPTGRYRYYDSMLMMMALLHCSGEFKVYL